MAGKKKTRSMEKSLYKNFLSKADASFLTFKQYIEAENWHSTGINGTHTCIGISDALCVGLAGIKNAGDHATGPKLLKEVLEKYTNRKGVATHCQQYAEVINLKNLVEYDTKIFHKTTAQPLIKKTERFYLWAKEMVTEFIE